MFAMLLPFSSIFHISPDQLCQQLEREYELRIDLEADLTMDPGNLEERKRALLSVCVAQMARMPPHERWARLMANNCQCLHAVDHRPLWRDRMLQFASDCSSSGARDSVNDNVAAATSAISPQTHQFAYISEVEREPQQGESSSSPRNRNVRWARSFRMRTTEITHGHPRENSPQYSHMSPIDHAPLDDRHLFSPPLASPAPTTPHKSTHLQSRGIIPTLFVSTFVVVATLMTALMVAA